MTAPLIGISVYGTHFKVPFLLFYFASVCCVSKIDKYFGMIRLNDKVQTYRKMASDKVAIEATNRRFSLPFSYVSFMIW